MLKKYILTQENIRDPVPRFQQETDSLTFETTKRSPPYLYFEMVLSESGFGWEGSFFPHILNLMVFVAPSAVHQWKC